MLVGNKNSLWDSKINYNTVIGGQGVITTSASQLETLLNISSGTVEDFTIIGNDIKCNINILYTIPFQCFLSNTNITSYLDLDGNVSRLGNNSFQNAVNLTDIFFPYNNISVNFRSFRNTGLLNASFNNVLAIGNEAFYGCLLLETFAVGNININMLGTTVLDNLVFRNCNNLATITVPVVLQTNNSGGRDGDVAYAEDTLGSTIIYI